MKPEHTPGPWIVDATPAVAPCRFIVRHKSATCDAWVPVADCSWSVDAEANARLIAAAPELLAVLRACERRLTDICTPDDVKITGAVIKAARKVILQAGGSTDPYPKGRWT